jgi:uncharacterized protein with PIN domain
MVTYELNRRASIKDIIESLGVPHPLIGKIACNGQERDFSCIPVGDDSLEVHPLPVPFDVRIATLLRPVPFSSVRFAVDVNVARLATLLRLAGFDTLCDHGLDDQKLAGIAAAEQRILLTRDRLLLQRRVIVFGHLVRQIYPEKQLAEVINLFGLKKEMQPFSRCMACNGLLVTVDKQEVDNLLEPLTRKYYEEFSRCGGCGKVYWQGSHFQGLMQYLEPFI